MDGRWIGSWMLLVVSAGGCTRPNPSFDTEDAAATAMDDTGASTSAAPDGGATSDDGGEQTTTPSTTAADGSSTTYPTGETESPVCELDFPPPFEIFIDPPIDVPDCIETLMIGVSPTEDLGDFEVEGWVCGDCPCGVRNGVLRTLSTDVPIPPELPECYRMHLDLRPAGGTFCGVDAYSYSIQTLPWGIVSNVVDPDLPEPFAFELQGPAIMPCEEDCMGRPPGYYGLIATSGDVVPTGGAPTPLPSPMQDYEVESYGSGLDDQCVEQARWVAMPLL